MKREKKNVHAGPEQTFFFPPIFIILLSEKFFKEKLKVPNNPMTPGSVTLMKTNKLNKQTKKKHNKILMKRSEWKDCSLQSR